ncbi:2TM domain-containing protein [Ascidiimonas aurantiaca]|uniref:2TM domain-containing protein n=1 Tax=Ascidiimonas aurantiaca TaxID=1685432 RepID=UPI0030EE7FAC
MENPEKESSYLKAKEKVENIKKFYTSIISYIVVISGLAALNYWINEWRYAWFLWAAFGWGIGLVFQALRAFEINPFFNKDWEERKIREFMDKDDRRNRWE